MYVIFREGVGVERFDLITINSGCVTPQVAVPAAATYIWSDNSAIFLDVVRITGKYGAPHGRGLRSLNSTLDL